MRKLILVALAASALALGVGTTAQAASFTFDGYIRYHNDVVTVPFTLLADATDVRVWTDSFQNNTNFDPITAVWQASGELVGQNDDRSNIAPGQTYYDSGLVFSTLAAGNYLFTIASYNNFANGSTLAEGFRYDGATPIPIEDWWVDRPGYWRVHLSGVDDATAPVGTVPEPTTMLLLGTGLAGAVLASRRRR